MPVEISFLIQISMSNPESRYTPEEAMDEASLLKKKVESGAAPTYAEAEGLVEQDLSVESPKTAAEVLKAKIQVAKEQKEKDIKQRLSDREVLIAEMQRNDILLQTAQETLDYFVGMQELGELDPADVEKLEEIRALVGSVEQQRQEIDKKIGALESRPEVSEQLYDAAKKEDIERTTKKEFEQAHEQFYPQIDKLAQSIKTLAERKGFLWEQRNRQEKEVSVAWKGIAELFDTANNMLGDKSEFRYVLAEILNKARTPEEVQQSLSKQRQGLGMFKGKEKAAIDFILSKTQKFEEYNRVRSGLSALEKQIEAAEGEEAQLAEQFTTTMLSSWEVQNKINELRGSHPNASDLPSDLDSRLRHHMEDFADLKRSRYGKEGWKELGKHGGWYEANQIGKNRTLYKTWENITKTVRDNMLTWKNPKEIKKQE